MAGNFSGGDGCNLTGQTHVISVRKHATLDDFIHIDNLLDTPLTLTLQLSWGNLQGEIVETDYAAFPLSATFACSNNYDTIAFTYPVIDTVFPIGCSTTYIRQ